MRLLAPAKINLHLRVGSRRADGFHPLLSWMCTVGLFDTLSLQLQHGGGAGDPFALTCDLPGLPTDRSNLVVKAGAAFLAELEGEATNRRVVATLAKRIPMGAGLGGGSSDGARTLLGLDRLCGTSWPAERLSDFAARFGSDLSFFFFGPSSVCRGRGEIVRPIPRPLPRAAVLILPGIHMGTPDVYRRFDTMGLGSDDALGDTPDLWLKWAQLDAGELMAQLINDLEPPAFAISPTLADLRARAEALAGRAVRMSGSGSSLFTLYDTAAEAEDAARTLAAGLSVPAVAVEVAPALDDDLA